MLKVRLLALLSTLLPTAALATNVIGTLPANTTWTPAGNPWVLTGDVTVPAGVTLTIEPGVQVTFASTDGLGSGVDAARVELIVDGTLDVQGTSASPVTITASSAFGTRVQGTATFNNAILNGGRECLRVSSGTLSFNNSTLQNCTQALNAEGGTSNLNYSVVRASGSSSLGYYAITLSANANLIHNTITANPYGGVYVNSFIGTVNIYDNIITSNGSYGVNFATSTSNSPTRSVHHNDVWSHSIAEYSRVTPGAGSISANPLFVSASNLRITEYSPARLMASDGTDMGALPYAGDPSASLQGALVADLTLTGANTLAGDLIVRPGVTLTLASGASLTFASSDGQASGIDTARVELIVDGTLSVQGTSASPVTITASSAFGTRVQGTATFNNAILNGGRECLRVSSGTLSFNNSTLQNCTQALNAEGGTSNLNYSVVKSSGSSSLGYYAITLSANANLIHNTITANPYGGIYVNSFTPGTVNIYDNIITSNGNYGVNFATSTSNSPTRSVHHNDVWSHSIADYTRVTPGAGSISANPLFVSATNFTLQETSPCRNIASDGTDMGAFPYVPVTAAYVVVTPSPHTMTVQGTQQFTATAYDSANNPLPRTFTWTADPAAGSVNSSGLFTAGCTPGTYTTAVTATADGRSASATVTLNPGAVSTITVSPSSATVPINGTQQFTATARDACNNSLPSTPISWVITNGGGSLNSSGLFTAGTTPGTFTNTVRATSGTVFGSATVTVTGGALASIEVSPNSTTLPINGTQQFTATGRDSAGNTVPVTVTWSVVNGGGAINSSGLFTAGTTPGTYASTIRATSGSISGFATVTVQPGALASIEVSPSSATLPINGTQQFTATGRDSAGNAVPVTVSWSANGGGTINSSGLFTAGTVPGTFANAIQATSGTISGFATVSVQPGALASIEVSPSSVTLPINGTQQFTATGRDSAGNTVPVTVSWSVVNDGGVINSSGLFTAGTTPGTFTNTIRASSGTLSGFATVTVQAGALASIDVTPDTATLGINGTQQFTATGRDSAGNTVPATISWSVVNGGGTINSSGLFTAGTVAGTFAQTVRASSGTLSATASVTVNPGPVQTVAVSPASVTLPVRGTQQFTATATDAWGNTVPGTPSWSVSPAAVGTIDSSGAFTAGNTAGTYPAAVTATLSGVSGSANVTLTARTLARIVVTPATLNLEPRGTRQFSAQGQDADGNVVPITPVWSVVNGAGSITQDGLFTATQVPGIYANSVVATADGVTGTASVTVVPGGIQRVVISPQNPTVAVQGPLTFTAKAFDAFDNELPGLTPAWEVINGGGTITASGVFTAGTASGRFADTVKVTLGGMSTTTSVTVATDFDGDGLPDAWEIANGLDPSQPGDASLDPDGDTLSNLSEFQVGANPRDADTDDDGALDGREQRPGENADGDALANVLDPDSDNDGLFDGTEMAVTSPHANTDTSKGSFAADTDPATSTDPLSPDTDGDGRRDGEEDANHNGKVDPGETDPNHPDLFCSSTPQCGPGQVCQDGVCVDDPGGGPGDGDGNGGGCGCSGSGAGVSLLGLLLLSLLGRIGGRRRSA